MRLRSFFNGAVATAALACLATPSLAERLTVALSANVTLLDPAMTTTVGTDLSVISHLYTPLVIRGPDLKLQPALASSWEAVDDNTWRFKLRPDVKFANGEPLDAAAVKWNIDRILDPNQKAPVRAWLSAIKDVRVVDPTTVDLVTSSPYPSLPDQMSMIFFLPPVWSKSHNPAIEALGSGPYDLVEFKPGDRVVLKAKPNYTAGPKPAFDDVVFRVIPEDASRISALLVGEVDLISGVAPSELARIKNSGKFVVGAVPSTRMQFVKFNNLKAPFKDNPALRLALNYAVDKQAILDTLFEGYGSLNACQPLNESYFGFNPDLKPFPYDPAKAKELLAKAGYPNGLTIEFEVPLGRYLLGAEVSQAIAAQLEEVGVKTNLVEMEYGRWIDKFQNAGNVGSLSYLGQSWPTLNADGMLSLFETGNRYSYYENADFTRLIREARSTTDEKKRVEIYKKATESFCADPAHIVLFNQPTTYAFADRVKWTVRSDDWFRAVDVQLAK
ncbi:ABC transporter substrate-binding protein [Microvirga antarctica]|uniref:ABC transporter substrate-binding protein n=1 Tax=Microvirga antarctica TaxID=2819233 RepID=UPI001B30E3CA|nr:ABC transporter substrate-binding protein [Microvirga antarctica]